ncbi:DoxX family protein [Chryseobacterium sp. R2ACT005]|uniref:DoxX family protein n=1 Tax=Chryseobacterium sp. R2ACT005 TaxID=3416668 RepID=UPI003CFB6043
MPEAILPIVLIISLIIFKLTRKEYEFAFSARIAMAVMLLTAGIAHFVYTQGMALMIPQIIPYKTEMVYATGFLEIIGAAALLIPGFQKTIGWLLIVFFCSHPSCQYICCMGTCEYEGGGLFRKWSVLFMVQNSTSAGFYRLGLFFLYRNSSKGET